MKRKTKIVLFSFLTINFIVQIIYQFVIRPKIPYDWWYMSDTNYPLDIADHFTDCFFGLNYFLVGYLFFAEKYYCDSMSEGKLTNRWRHCAQMCQIGGLITYVVLWLGFSDSPSVAPVGTLRGYVFMLLMEKLSDKQWESLINHQIGYKNFIYLAIILAPVILSFIVYTTHFFIMYIRRKKAGCSDKKWNRWNILYIIVILLVFCWSFEAVRFFPLMSKIPWFRSFLIEYYQKKPPSLPPGCVS